MFRCKEWIFRGSVEALDESHGQPNPVLPLQAPRQIAPCVAVRVGRHVFGRALGHHLSTAIAAFGAQIDHPIGFSDDIQIMLNDDDAVTPIDQAM